MHPSEDEINKVLASDIDEDRDKIKKTLLEYLKKGLIELREEKYGANVKKTRENKKTREQSEEIEKERSRSKERKLEKMEMYLNSRKKK